MSADLRADERSQRAVLRGVYIQGGVELPITVRAHEAVVWLNSPKLARVLPPGKRWIRSTDPELFSNSLTPGQFGEALRAVGDVDELGTDRIRGKPAKHVRAELDVDDLADNVGGSTAERFERLSQGESALVLDVWYPPGKRPLRYAIRVDMPRPGGGRPQFAILQLDVLAYDVPVRVPAPPADQVIDEEEEADL
jgi:hypothetical protein